jgi:hypothetical protein
MPDVIEPPAKLSPPIQSAVIDDTSGAHKTVWSAYYQNVADQISSVWGALQTIRKGVTDGSEATAGHLGEYLTASGSAGLTNNATVTVASLTLPAGDWDVTGGVTFTISGAASSHYAVGIDGVFGTEIIATIPTGSGTWRLPAGTVRRNVTADTAVTLVALAGFSSGTVSAAGTIQARRMR